MPRRVWVAVEALKFIRSAFRPVRFIVSTSSVAVGVDVPTPTS